MEEYSSVIKSTDSPVCLTLHLPLCYDTVLYESVQGLFRLGSRNSLSAAWGK